MDANGSERRGKEDDRNDTNLAALTTKLFPDFRVTPCQRDTPIILAAGPGFPRKLRSLASHEDRWCLQPGMISL